MSYSGADYIEDVINLFVEHGLVHECDDENGLETQFEQTRIAIKNLLEIKNLAANLVGKIRTLDELGMLDELSIDVQEGLARQLMQKVENLRPRYLVAENWTHCFVGSSPSLTRWVIDLEESGISVVKAQVLTGHVWEEPSEDERDDLIEDLETNSVRSSVIDFGLSFSWALPEWALETPRQAPAPRAGG